MVDDMGWMDTTPYGSQYYKTPYMDRFAKGGILFTDAYSAHPLCSPTRASILTGKYPARLGIVAAEGHEPPRSPGKGPYPDHAPRRKQTIEPRTKRFLEPAEYTIAEAFRDAGYATAHLGKWHLGVLPEHGPANQGFEVSFHGVPDAGPTSYFSPYQFKSGSVTDGPEGELLTHRLTDEAIRFMQDNRDRPFLMHLWHYSVHRPWSDHAPAFSEAFRGTVDPRGFQRNAVMASMLASVDSSLGRVMDELRALGLEKDTVVIVYSDNGGNTHSDLGPEKLPLTNNAPLRSGKGRLYEGGVRVPLIVQWPGHVEPGSRSNALVSSIDFYPTLLEVAGIEKRAGLHIDGISIVPALEGKGPFDRDRVFNFFPQGATGRLPGVSVRKGDWKLIRWFETSSKFPESFELYNLSEDIGERHNLAPVQVERVDELNALIDEFLAETNAKLPIPNPRHRRKGLGHIGDWTARDSTISTATGILQIAQLGSTPFITTERIGKLDQIGRLRVDLKLRIPQGEGKGTFAIRWRTEGETDFPESQSRTFEVRAGSEWNDVSVDLPSSEKIVHLRLHLPSEPDRVEVAAIMVSTVQDERVRSLYRWDF